MTSLPLDAPTVLQALTLELELEPVDDEQVVDGQPHVGSLALTEVDDWEVGVWELTPGIVTDVEVEEVFVVLRGRAILRREDGSETELLPGSIGRLEDGEETEWEVLETLRKIYIA